MHPGTHSNLLQLVKVDSSSIRVQSNSNHVVETCDLLFVSTLFRQNPVAVETFLHVSKSNLEFHPLAKLPLQRNRKSNFTSSWNKIGILANERFDIPTVACICRKYSLLKSTLYVRAGPEVGQQNRRLNIIPSKKRIRGNRRPTKIKVYFCDYSQKMGLPSSCQNICTNIVFTKRPNHSYLVQYLLPRQIYLFPTISARNSWISSLLEFRTLKCVTLSWISLQVLKSQSACLQETSIFKALDLNGSLVYFCFPSQTAVPNSTRFNLWLVVLSPLKSVYDLSLMHGLVKPTLNYGL